METSRLGLSDLHHTAGHGRTPPATHHREYGHHPASSSQPSAAPPAQGQPEAAHTILHARTPQAARQIRQLTSSLRDCNRAVNDVDALSRELQELANDQEGEIRELKSQLSTSERRRRKAQSQTSQPNVRFRERPVSSSGYDTSPGDRPSQTTGYASSTNSGMESLSGMLGQSLRQQDELRRELQQQGRTLRHLSMDPLRHSQAPPPVVSYPPAPVPAAAQPHSNDGRYGDKLHGLSESLSRIDGRLTSQRDREEAVSSAHLHNKLDTLRGDLQRLEQGQGKGPVPSGLDQHMSTLHQQMNNLESKHQQALTSLQQSLTGLQHAPSKQDVLLQEVTRLREEIKSGQERAGQSQHRQTLDSTERLAGRLDSLDVSLRRQAEEKSAVLERLDQLQRRITGQEEQRSSTLAHVLKLQEKIGDMERERDRLTMQVELMKAEMQKQETLRSTRDEQGVTAALRESERVNAELISRLQHFEEDARTLRSGNEQLQGELRRSLAASHHDAEVSGKEKDKAVQLMQKYKARLQAESEQKQAMQQRLQQLTEQRELEKAQLQSELSTWTARYTTTEEDRMELQKELDALRAEGQEALRHYKTQHGHSSSLTEKLTSKLGRIREKEKELQQQLKTCVHREGVMREEIERLKRTSKEFQLQHQKQVEALMTQLKQQSASADQRMEAMTQRQHQQLKELSQIIDQQKGNVSSDKARLDELNAEKRLASGEHIRMQRRCVELEKELDTFKRKVTQQREAYKEKISQLKERCITSDGQTLKDVQSQLSASRRLGEQILQDQETILRAVAGEVDSLITQVTEHSALPKPILPDTSGMETDARKWVSAILGKLAWLQRELQLKEQREKFRKASDASSRGLT
ncbi:centrosomal protein of 128 kDa-like isoform X1 [Sycon ciliatum]|uniref:centrosomal protein of 128 kDa-like isoform X1 n=1 Tax=Sycon ciliatum TaxID=27933 RepID=UPI0031F6D261